MSITSLPSSIGNLTNLKKLKIWNIFKISNLPDAIGWLASLESMDLQGLGKLTSLPRLIGNLTNLEKLRLYRMNKLHVLPDEIVRPLIHNIVVLQLVYCHRITPPLRPLVLSEAKEHACRDFCTIWIQNLIIPNTNKTLSFIFLWNKVRTTVLLSDSEEAFLLFDFDVGF